MLDALEVGNPHEVPIGVPDHDDVSMYVQSPLAAEAVVRSQMLRRCAHVHRVVVSKGLGRIHGKERQPLALITKRKPTLKVKVVRPHVESVVINLVNYWKKNGARTASRYRVDNGTNTPTTSFLLTRPA